MDLSALNNQLVCNFQVLESILLSKGLTSSDINNIKDELLVIVQGGLGETPQNVSQELQDISSNIQQITKQKQITKADQIITDYTNKIISDVKKQKDRIKVEKSANRFNNANIIKSEEALSLEEPSITSKKYGEDKQIEKASYTTDDDYPDSYGFIDSVKNFFKVNTLKGLFNIRHQSNAQLKIDKDGNTLLYIPKNLKIVVDGDYQLEVRGNRDENVGKNYFREVLKEETVKVFGEQHIKVIKDRFVDANFIHENSQ